MIKAIKAVALGLSLLLATFSVCSAQDFQKGLEAYDANYAAGLNLQKGLEAYNAKDYAEALRQFRLLAEQGWASGQYFLGEMYDHGKGVTQDYKEAARLYRLSAEQGLKLAQTNLGEMYDHGKGVTQD